MVSGPLPNPPESLIVTADDFGFGVATSRGIIRAYQAGIVTATSLMAVTGDHVAASIPLLADASTLEIGLHLVLTGRSQRPLVAGFSSGLVGRDGGFHSLPKLLWLAWRRRLNRQAVFDEICAQAAKAATLLGRPPAYVDGHHHAHQLPVIREALIDAIRNGVLPAITRCTVEAPSVRSQVPGCTLRRAVMHRLGSAARPLFAEARVWANDSCFGMIAPRDLRLPSPWGRYLPHLPAKGSVEWFVHPGEADDTLAGRDSYFHERPMELDSLIQLTRHPDWPRWAAVLTDKSALVRRRNPNDEIRMTNGRQILRSTSG